MLSKVVFTRSLTLTGSMNDQTFDLVVDDPEILEAISKSGSPEAGLESVLKVGARALLAVSNKLDSSLMREELGRAVDKTTSALDELERRFKEAVGEDGALGEALSQASQDLSDALKNILASQANPSVQGSLVGRLQETTVKLDQLMANAQRQIVDELHRAAESQSNAVRKAASEMRDLDPNSALGRALTDLQSQVRDLVTAVAANKAAAEAHAVGTRKGINFEDHVAQTVAEIAGKYNDQVEQTGQQPGLAISNKRPSLKGDVTCSINEAASIVFEAMDRDPDDIKRQSVLKELDEAMRNRGAQAAVAVVSSADAKVMLGQPLMVLGANTFAVVLDKEEPDTMALAIAYGLARKASMATVRSGSELDFRFLKQGVETINQKLSALADIRQHLSSIATSQRSALVVVTEFERSVHDEVDRLLKIIEEHTNSENAAA